jgi:hypothetical protein
VFQQQMEAVSRMMAQYAQSKTTVAPEDC